MPYNPSAFVPTYSKALMALIDCNYKINILKNSEKMKEDITRYFYEYLVESYNVKLYEFSDNIVKYRANSKLYVD